MSSTEHHDLIVEYRNTGDPQYLLHFYTHPDYTKTYKDRIKYKWVRKYQLIARTVGAGPSRVLDVGCATRQLVEPLFSPDVTYNGFDINPDFGPDYVGDVHRLADLVPHNYDWVILSDILEHVHAPVDVLRQAGMVAHKILVVVPQLYHLEAISFFNSWRNERDRHIHVGGTNAWQKVFGQAGLKRLSLRGFYYVPSLSPDIKNSRLRKLDDFFDRSSFFRLLDRVVFERLSWFPLIRCVGQEAMFVLRDPSCQ